MDPQNMKKFVTAEEAAKVVKSGDWVDFGFGTGFPELFDRALAGRAEELTDVKIRGGLVYAPKIEVLEADPEGKAFTWYSWHIGGYERKKQAGGQIRFVPMLLRQVPFLYRQHFRVDVCVVPVSKPDADGYCTLGAANYCFKTIMSVAKTVIFEVNEHYPVIPGVDGSNRVHISDSADHSVPGIRHISGKQCDSLRIRRDSQCFCNVKTVFQICIGEDRIVRRSDPFHLSAAKDLLLWHPVQFKL